VSLKQAVKLTIINQSISHLNCLALCCYICSTDIFPYMNYSLLPQVRTDARTAISVTAG